MAAHGRTRSQWALCAVLAGVVPLVSSASPWVLRPNLYFGAKTATAAPDMVRRHPAARGSSALLRPAVRVSAP